MPTIDSYFEDAHSLTMAQVVKQFTQDFKVITQGDVITGKVVAVYPDELRVDLNAKSEGIVPITEVIDPQTGNSLYQVGDEISVFIISPETKDGKILLSANKASVEQKWRDLEESNKEQHTIEVTVIDVNRGGLLVIFDNVIRGFIPLSQLSMKHRPKLKKDAKSEEVKGQLQSLLHSALTVKIIEVQAKRNRLILSERAAEVKSPTMRADLKVSEKLTGKISNILNYGIFVDLGGFDGFVHISEISWKRINPDDLLKTYKIGQKIDVLVINIEEGGKRIALSIKQLSPNPWNLYASKYFIGQNVEAIVSNITDFGLFLELEKDFEGLVHQTEIPELDDVHFTQRYKVGQKLTPRVLSIDTNKQRITLSLKEAREGASPAKELTPEVVVSADTSNTTPEKVEKIEKEEKEDKKHVIVDESIADEHQVFVEYLTSIEGVGKATAKKICEAGFTSEQLVIEAGLSKLSLIPGIRRALAEKIIISCKEQK